eukprot:8914018-Alexandrium_andersonii.AAC.1
MVHKARICDRQVRPAHAQMRAPQAVRHACNFVQTHMWCDSKCIYLRDAHVQQKADTHVERRQSKRCVQHECNWSADP